MSVNIGHIGAALARLLRLLPILLLAPPSAATQAGGPALPVEDPQAVSLWAMEFQRLRRPRVTPRDGAPEWFELGLSVIAEWNTIPLGGIQQRSSGRVLTTFDGELDLGRLFAESHAGKLAVVAQSMGAEDGGSLDSGDFQIYSNLESDENRDDVMELWYEQDFAASGARLKVGKVDANSEFAYVEVAGDFSHSSAGFSPSIVGFPSYPDAATSVNLFIDTLSPWEGTTATLGYGLYDGSLAVDGVRTGRLGPSTFLSSDRSDDLLHLLQWEIIADRGQTEKTRVTLGAFWHTGQFERFDGGTDNGTEGLFATWEHSVRRPNLPRGHIHFFAQYGWADDRVSPISEHAAAGLVFDGPLEHRPDDRAGIYASLADLSDAAGAGFASNELAIDAYYRLRWSERFWVQPEVQLIVDPSGSETISDALVLGLRIAAEF